MPEVYFRIEWPDGETMNCYSPSTVVREYFRAGMVLTVDELMRTSSTALGRASERVEERYGFGCVSAAAQLSDILSRAKNFPKDGEVKILSVG